MSGKITAFCIANIRIRVKFYILFLDSTIQGMPQHGNKSFIPSFKSGVSYNNFQSRGGVYLARSPNSIFSKLGTEIYWFVDKNNALKLKFGGTSWSNVDKPPINIYNITKLEHQGGKAGPVIGKAGHV